MAQTRRKRMRSLAPAEGPRCTWCDGVSANPAWGDGKCSECHGAGRVAAGAGTRMRTCSRCNGTGRCPECGGEGMSDLDPVLSEHGEFALAEG